MDEDKKILTTSNGNPVDDNQHTVTVGKNGPVSMEDFHFIDKITNFDRERVPERVVHAKGAGAHGYFEVTKDWTSITKAKFLNKVGKRTPIFVRFSTVTGQLGSADTTREPRGFAVKFYTEEGNWDAVGNNVPVFFVRDPIKFPDLIHSQKKCPGRGYKDPNTFWDFISLVPETNHIVTMLFSDRGIPDGYRHMHGFPNHTFKLVNEKGEYKYVKWHFKSDQGIKNLSNAEATKLAGENPDYATQDLYEAIEQGKFPSWTVYIQVMDQKDVETYKYDPFDITKVISQKDFPLQEVGRFVLDKNPTNSFVDVELVAFSPSHMVPGIESTYDKMFQGRMFSYPDTHRHRIGVNYLKLPINKPRFAKICTYHRDGTMNFTDNGGASANYEPNSMGGPRQLLKEGGSMDVSLKVSGIVKRHVIPVEDVDFQQARDLWNLQPKDAKERSAKNVVEALAGVKEHIVKAVVELFGRVSEEFKGMILSELNKSKL